MYDVVGKLELQMDPYSGESISTSHRQKPRLLISTLGFEVSDVLRASGSAERERERDNACSSRDNVSTTQFLPTKAVELFEVFGCTIFSPVHLREYAVVIGSLVATLTELYEPFGINDNVARQKGKKKNPQHS